MQLRTILKLFLISFTLTVISLPKEILAGTLLEKDATKISAYLSSRLPSDKGILILDYSQESGRPSYIGKYLTKDIRGQLSETGKIKVLDRGLLDQYLNEAKLKFNGLLDEKTALDIGKMEGAKVAVYGIVSDAKDSYEVETKIVDIEKGILIGSQTTDIKKTRRLIQFLNGKIDQELSAVADVEAMKIDERKAAPNFQESASSLDITGNWTGAYRSDKVRLTKAVFTMIQDGNSVSGSFKMSNRATGSFRGKIKGDFLTLNINEETPRCPGTFIANAIIRGRVMRLIFSGTDCLGRHSRGIGDFFQE